MTNVILLAFCFDWNPKFVFDTLLIVALSQGQNVRYYNYGQNI